MLRADRLCCVRIGALLCPIRGFRALNGVNLPLAFVGQEYVWTQVFGAYNISFTEQQSFYSGPAFLPWFRMGNMRGWGGPISMEWLEGRRDLQASKNVPLRLSCCLSSAFSFRRLPIPPRPYARPRTTAPDRRAVVRRSRSWAGCAGWG